MNSVGAFQAKTHLSRLLEDVERGESVTITRHGKAVARLVPVNAASDQQRLSDTVSRIKAFAARHRLKGLDWKKLRDEGRR